MARLGGLFGRGRRDRELSDEFLSHLGLHIDDLVQSGMTPDEARRRALVDAGGLEAAKESYRDRRGVPVVETLRQDVRYGARLLGRNPGFALVVILSLALGIGANTATFSVINALMWRTLPVPEPHRLVQFLPGNGRTTWTYPLWSEMQTERQTRGVGRLIAWGTDTFELSTGGGLSQPADRASARSSSTVFG